MKEIFMILALGISLVSSGQHKNPKRGLAYGYHKEAGLYFIRLEGTKGSHQSRFIKLD